MVLQGSLIEVLLHYTIHLLLSLNQLSEEDAAFLLKDILEKAKIKQNGHKDRNFYIVARASDDYKATFSWAELFNNPTGENAYILFEESGKPIKNGEMILLGGLDELKKEDSGSGTPLLSRIPIIKWFFSSRKKGKNNSKLHIFIKPTVVY